MLEIDVDVPPQAEFDKREKIQPYRLPGIAVVDGIPVLHDAVEAEAVDGFHFRKKNELVQIEVFGQIKFTGSLILGHDSGLQWALVLSHDFKAPVRKIAVVIVNHGSVEHQSDLIEPTIPFSPPLYKMTVKVVQRFSDPPEPFRSISHFYKTVVLPV